MVLDRIILKDFLSYDYLEHHFVKRPLQIQGKNLTDEGQESIGSGKSGLQTAIEYCITSTNSRGVGDKEIVSFGCEQSNLQLYASCDIRKESLHIEWVIKTKGSNKLKLRTKSYDGSWEDVKFSNVADGKKFISSWFAISKEDLFNYYIVNRNRFKSFFQSSNKEKVDLINRFSDASITDGIEKIDNEELEKNFAELNSDVSKMEGKLEMVIEKIDIEKSRDFKIEMQEQISDIDEEIESIEESIEETEEEIEVQKSNIEDINSRIMEIDAEISEIDEAKVDTESKIKDENKILSEIKERLQSSQEIVDKFISTDWEGKRDKYTGILKKHKSSEGFAKIDLFKQEEQKTKILTLISNLDIKLGGSITCPSCSHEFVLDGDIDDVKSRKAKALKLKEIVIKSITTSENTIKDIKALINDIEEKVSSINKKEAVENENKNSLIKLVNKVNSEFSTVEKRIGKIKDDIRDLGEEKSEYKDEINDLKIEIKDCENTIESYKSKILSFKAEIKAHRDQKNNLKLGSNKDIIKQLRAEQATFTRDIASLKLKAESIGDKIYKRNQWKNNFKQFKMFLANQSLETIEFHCNRYLKGMKTDLRVSLDGYKIMASGAVKDEITAKIVRNGVERSFGSYSGGERAKVIMAGILANRHMINSTHPYGGLDFLSIDEITEGLDPGGIKDLMDVMKGLQIPIYMITHVLSDVIDNDIMLIVKENGISKIKNS